MAGGTNETAFNAWLAEVLESVDPRHGEGYTPEKRERRRDGRGSRQPDIRVSKTPSVIIETAYEGDRDEDALRRLAQGDATVFAVSIPEAYGQMKARDAKAAMRDGSPALGYAVLQEGWRFPSSGYVHGSAADFAEFIRAGSVNRTAVAKAAERVKGIIDEAREILERELPDSLHRELESLVFQRSSTTAFNTALLLWLDALLVQEHLLSKDRIPALRKCPLPTFGGPVNPGQLVKAWEVILEHNWQAVFEPAVDALKRIMGVNRKAVSVALGKVMDCIDEMREHRLGDLVNIGAELFPSLSEDQKNAAAFYTTAPTAEMLAAMTIRRADRDDWDDASLFDSVNRSNAPAGRKVTVADFACGTGTLLRAAYSRIRGFHESAAGRSADDTAMHKAAMEGGVVGGDVSPIAAHLSNSSMTVLGDGDCYGKTQIAYVPVGKSKTGIAVGTLGLLRKSSFNDLFTRGSRTASGTGGGALDLGITAEDGAFDYILMNPPYSRTRGNQSAFDISGLSESDRRFCQKEWGRLLKGHAANKKSGMAASFLCVAAKKVKPGGRIGFVLPVTAAFAPSWSETRVMLATHFKDILAVSKAGQSGGEDGLSADTGMGEMLLVATRRRFNELDGKPSSIHCTTLKRIPTRLGEAGAVGQNAARNTKDTHGSHSSIRIGNDELGTSYIYEPLSDEPWLPLGCLNPDMVDSVIRLVREGTLVERSHGSRKPMRISVPMTRARELFNVGPTHHLIGCIPGSSAPSGGYVVTPMDRPTDHLSKAASLWEADSTKQIRMVVDATHKGVPRDPKAVAQLEESRSTLHYAKGMRWTSQSILVATTTLPVFGGNQWASLIHGDHRVAACHALWGNSILGMVTHWTQGQRTHGGRAITLMGAVNEMPCPDLAELDNTVLDAATAAFDELKTLELRPACQAHADENRKRIDAACAQMLGLPKARSAEAMDLLRRQWCAEPTVHGNNKVALALLREAGLVEEAGLEPARSEEA